MKILYTDYKSCLNIKFHQHGKRGVYFCYLLNVALIYAFSFPRFVKLCDNQLKILMPA